MGLCALLAVAVILFAAARFSEPQRAGWAPGSEYSGGALNEPRGPAGRLDTTDRAGPTARAEMRAFAAGRVGYVVWESRRPSGTRQLKYRIWKRNLDGSGLTMISGQESQPGYAHLGPRISPDGRFVVFAGRRWNSESASSEADVIYGGAYVAGPFDVWVIEIDPSTLKAGVPRELLSLRGLVGTAGQDRFFVWKDARTLCVSIPAHKGIFEVDVVSDRIGVKVVHDVEGRQLLAPSGRWLFSASPGAVALTDLTDGPHGRAPGETRRFPGCQAIAAGRGEALVWVREPGKLAALDLRVPSAAADLADGKPLSLTRAVRDKHGPYHYCYFPALGRGRNVLAFGASRFPPSLCGETFRPWLRHSHKSADYEIFLAAVDPKTLAVVGDAVRYSFNDHSAYPWLVRRDIPEEELRRGQVLDRFPDVWIRESGDAAVRAPDRTPLEQARDLETVNPKAAVAAYERLAKESGDEAARRSAGARARDLRNDPRFRRELAAWEILERVRRAAASGGRPALRTIRAGYAGLKASYPDTRAMLEARGVVHRLGVAVPRETAASREVVAVVDAVAANVSKPKTLREIYPYTQALMAVEFEVRKVRSGDVGSRAIVVVMRAMADGKPLPAASLRSGAVRRLRLARWEAQKHLEGLPLADDVLDLDATYYFALPDS